MSDTPGPIVPLISSSVTGPLGVCHLPRLWLKILLHACGRLPEGYRHGSGGFDSMTIDGLGLDAGAFVSFIETSLPTYLVCEAWVREHATKLDTASITALNQAIITRDKPAGAAAELRAELGIDDSIGKAIALNDLDDWALVHAGIRKAGGS